jgi:hypothetical protein
MSSSVWREALNMSGEERTVATRNMRGRSSHAPTSPTCTVTFCASIFFKYVVYPESDLRFCNQLQLCFYKTGFTQKKRCPAPLAALAQKTPPEKRYGVEHRTKIYFIQIFYL